MKKLLAASALSFFLTACSSNIEVPDGQAQWDFDHGIQFSKTRLDDGRIFIEVVPNNKTNFNRLAAFLMRKSLQICKSYGFSLELLKGIETYDQKESFPNLIVSHLKANLTCPDSVAKKKKKKKKKNKNKEKS